MKDLKNVFFEIAKSEKGVFGWMVANFLVGLFVIIFTIFKLNPDSAVVKIGYGDAGGYKDGTWTDLIAFPLLAFVVGTLHSFVAVRIYEKKGAGMAIVFLSMSFLILVGIFIVFLRLLGEG